jgi:hypothetical protein
VSQRVRAAQQPNIAPDTSAESIRVQTFRIRTTVIGKRLGD